MQKKFKQLIMGWLVHVVIVWTTINLYIVIPYLYVIKTSKVVFHYQQIPETTWQYFLRHTFYEPDILTVIFFLLLAELNYQYLFKSIGRLLFTGTCLCTGILTFGALYWTNLSRFKLMDITTGIAPVLYMAGYALIYAIIRDYILNARHKKQQELQLAKNQLDALKAQLNPHFLFNSLNHLYGTALNENAPNTADGIDQLSQMMRYTITGIHENFVPLQDELTFIKHYLSLQQVRLPKKDSIRIDTAICESPSSLKIAPLLFLPFIENAFKYGISMDDPCFVTLAIVFAGRTLTLEVNNSIIKHQMEATGNNTGIKNAIKRLDLLYSDKYQLKQIDDGKEYKIRLTLTIAP